MNHKSTLAFFFLLFVSFLHAEEKRPNFADIPFGSSRDEVKKILLSKNYVFSTSVENLKENHLKFTGKVTNVKSTIYAVFNEDGKLVKTLVCLSTEDKDAIKKFRSLRKSLTKKYGKPDRDIVDSFLSPYRKGDGYAEQAVKVGKGFFISSFGHVFLDVTEDLIVTIAYESVLWPKELDRRKKVENEDL